MKTTQSEEFAHDEYSSLISKVKELSLHDQIRLLEQIASLVRHRTEDDTCAHSILEMRGKNKQVWESIDVNKYINDERQSWDILLNSQISVVSLTADIASQAAKLRATHGIRTPDAIQLATAINEGASTFVTNDFGLSSVMSIDVIVLDELTS
jgi:predicted nucleic acid-binding protein